MHVCSPKLPATVKKQTGFGAALWATLACLALQAEFSLVWSVSARQISGCSSPITIHITHPQNVLMDFGPLHSYKASVCQQLLQPDMPSPCDWQRQSICLKKGLMSKPEPQQMWCQALLQQPCQLPAAHQGACMQNLISPTCVFHGGDVTQQQITWLKTHNAYLESNSTYNSYKPAETKILQHWPC